MTKNRQERRDKTSRMSREKKGMFFNKLRAKLEESSLKKIIFLQKDDKQAKRKIINSTLIVKLN